MRYHIGGRSSPRSISAVAAVGAAALLASCSSSVSRGADPTYGAPSSELAVRGFLDAANAEDYPRMGALFGTKDGAAVQKLGIRDVEQRMIVLSKLLRHGSYELREANLAQLGPDRVRWLAQLTRSRKGNATVPIVTVPSKSGRWFVEQLDLDQVTAGSIP